MKVKETLQNLITNATPAEIAEMAKALQEQLDLIKRKEQEEDWLKVKCAILAYTQKYGTIYIDEDYALDSNADFDTSGAITLFDEY